MIFALLLSLAAIPAWAFAGPIVTIAIAAFVLQAGVQGAWGVIPAHLNELSPSTVRGTLPGFAYQLGNFVMSRLSPIQAGIAESHGNDFGAVLAASIGTVSIVLALTAMAGSEAKDVDFRAQHEGHR